MVLFLDFDGTLAPIRERPEDVWLDSSVRRALRRLVRKSLLTVYVISGRRQADVRRRVGVRGLRYLGVHGAEGFTISADGKRQLARLRELKCPLAAKMSLLSGWWVEDKRRSVAMHYRQAEPQVARRGKKMLAALLQPEARDLRILKGKKVWEVLPRAVGGKGQAVCLAVARFAAKPLVVYLGDDTTDEEAFAVLPRGLTIRVGNKPHTRARFYLRNPDEVREFLLSMEGELA